MLVKSAVFAPEPKMLASSLSPPPPLPPPPPSPYFRNLIGHRNNPGDCYFSGDRFRTRFAKWPRRDQTANSCFYRDVRNDEHLCGVGVYLEWRRGHSCVRGNISISRHWNIVRGFAGLLAVRRNRFFFNQRARRASTAQLCFDCGMTL